MTGYATELASSPEYQEVSRNILNRDFHDSDSAEYSAGLNERAK